MAEANYTTIQQEEEWRYIPGYEGIYSISRLGRVRRDKSNKGATAGLILKPYLGTDGYLYVFLSINHKGRRIAIHRLLAWTFIGPCPLGCNVNHKDGVKLNNDLSNLEYSTYSENSLHAFKLGLSPGAEDHGNAKLTNDNVRTIRALISKKEMTLTATAKQFNVNVTVISKIKRGEIWRTVF